MFPQINALPRAQREASAAQRQAQIHRRQRGADMRGHVIRALAGVGKQRIAVRHETLEKAFEIPAHVRVGVLLDEQRSRGVPQVQRHEAMLEPILGKPGFDLGGEVIKPAPARGECQFVESLVEHEV